MIRLWAKKEHDSFWPLSDVSNAILFKLYWGTKVNLVCTLSLHKAWMSCLYHPLCLHQMRVVTHKYTGVKLLWSTSFLSFRMTDDLVYKPLFYWTRMCPALANSVNPDQLASEEVNWSRSALFVILYVNLYQQSGVSNPIGWQLEMSVAS